MSWSKEEQIEDEMRGPCCTSARMKLLVEQLKRLRKEREENDGEENKERTAVTA